MSDLQGSTSERPRAGHKGRHYAFIESRIHRTFKNASLRNVRELAAMDKAPAPWIKNATNRDHKQLQQANLKLWSSRDKIDPFLDKLQHVYLFAEPLLTEALKNRFGVEVDVKKTCLHLYLPKQNPWYIIDSNQGVTARTVTLLDAALHNFAAHETCEPDSDFVTAPNARGHFKVVPIKRQISIVEFQNLCRELDIGARYSRYLEEQLRPKDGVARYMLQRWITDSEKAAFQASTQQALMTADIDFSARVLILNMLDGRKMSRHGQAMHFVELSILDCRLTGIVLIAPDLEQHRGVAPVIAYVPQDPEHPLKEYPSTQAFMSELTRQLRDNVVSSSTGLSYRQYFSRFIDQTQRGHFFAELQQRLFDVKWHEKEATDPLPSWQEVPKDKVNLRFSAALIRGDVWVYQFQAKLNKILNDAQHIAVSTADTDRIARWAWWDNFKKITSDIFNVALLIATPFIPGVGELMLAYTAYQITSDVIEGVVDMTEGMLAEATEHVVGVVTDIVQMAVFGAGMKTGEWLRLQLSPLVESMKPVTLPDGQKRLWHPDVTPYELPDVTLTVDSRPDERGLHSREGRTILPLDGKHFAVREDAQTGSYRITHPERPNAYLPELEHNGQGAWTHEAENPKTWESSKLMRRLGHRVEAFSDAELQHARVSSGTTEGMLRKMHVEHMAPPPLLDDSLKRLELQRQADQSIEHIRRGEPLDPSSFWFEQLAPNLEGWPSSKAVRVYQQADLTGPFRQYGNRNASGRQTLSTSAAHIMSGEFAQTLADFLDARELEAILRGPIAANKQVAALRNRLAQATERQKADIFKHLYQGAQMSSDPQVRLLRQAYPELPVKTAESLLGSAEPTERARISREQRLPLSIKSLAREAEFETRANHAYAGFDDGVQWVPETENLILNALRIHSDTFSELRVEVREGYEAGLLRCRVGEPEASTVRVLFKNEAGHYEIWDGGQRKLHEAANFYEAILEALPVGKRAQLGYRPGQGRFFKQWLMAKTEAPAERRIALAAPPIPATADIEVMTLLRGPSMSRSATTLAERVKDLFPHFNEQETSTFIRSLGQEETGHQTLTRLENELDELKVLLNRWQYQQPETWGPGSTNFRDGGGQHISERLIECFERKSKVFGERSTTAQGGYALDLSVDMRSLNLELWWKKMPDLKPYLDQIDTLNLDRTTFSATATGLLKDFPHLRQLSARKCKLTQLPDSIGRMHFLRTLRLIDNRITLTEANIEQLNNLTRLETIRLDDNPHLGRLPNVGRMPRLKTLCLSNTGATTWPDGLLGPLSKRRPRGFFLDLQANPIKEIPNVVPGSQDAMIIARTRLYAWDLSEVGQVMFKEYRRSVGIAPEQAYTAAAVGAMSQWPMNDDTTWWSAQVSGLGTFREEAWHDLMNEPGSADFFALIQKLTQSADYRAGGHRREQLSYRVWRMIEAVDLDTELRKEVFEMATSPTTCADAGAQVFNNMGIKVLACEAYAFSTSAEDLTSRLAKLAKGAARLARVNDIASADFASRHGNPDEVEVHLAYETGLAQRLGLPWQSESMLYRPLAGVSAKAIDTAFATVMSMEAGDGLINGMIEQPFWEKHLRDMHPDEFRRNARLYEQQTERLDQLREAQDARANATASSPARQEVLRQRLLHLATQLNVDEHLVLTGQAMTDASYDALLNDIGYEEKQLSRRLTREALQQTVP
ncbi:hypothetical protein HU727_006820 [Pseudomonas sp. SWRI153]|uniref:RING-type E3 ubiquitin transferase n=1 Tax=Pseudomonas khorasanensis TaxID=2745508 RepID=A0A923JFF8_9PSED|nr:NEL-type E3 ubiquitin ligase domain-containing protein [Pseudomonas khorasanensis]MBV4485296.1 hypothetical protein [Pseudomonas khorasanensis]